MVEGRTVVAFEEQGPLWPEEAIETGGDRPENQFSLTREALSTCGAQNQIPININN